MIRAEPALGIDFGTCDSKAAILADGRISLIVDEGRTHVSSTVYVPERGDLQVGSRRGEGSFRDAERLVTSIKRILGRPFSDPEVRAFDQGIGYRLAQGPNDSVLVRVKDVDYAPVQIVAAVLAHLRQLAEVRVGTPITRATMSVPVDTAPGYPDALRKAADMAGFTASRLVYEPVAAAWGARLPPAVQPRRVLVCDFGGGTFDCSLLIQRPDRLQVVGSAGEPLLGGDDFDTALAEAVAGQVFRAERVDLHRDQVQWAELVRHCEAAKRRLSAEPSVVLHMPGAYAKDGAAHHLELSLQRGAVEPYWQPLVDRAVEATARALAQAQWPAQILDELLLVGGTNLVPMVRREFTRRLSKQPTAVVSSDVVVAAGLALMGATWERAQADTGRVPAATLAPAR
jgi:molecular chaperone DnaK